MERVRLFMGVAFVCHRVKGEAEILPESGSDSKWPNLLNQREEGGRWSSYHISGELIWYMRTRQLTYNPSNCYMRSYPT